MQSLLPIVEAEKRETGLPVSPDGEAHGSSAWSELEGSGGVAVKLEVEQLSASHGVLVVDIPFNSEEDTRVEPLAIPPSWELVMIRSSHDTAMDRCSSGSGATYELVWPCSSELGKA